MSIFGLVVSSAIQLLLQISLRTGKEASTANLAMVAKNVMASGKMTFGYKQEIPHVSDVMKKSEFIAHGHRLQAVLIVTMDTPCSFITKELRYGKSAEVNLILLRSPVR